MTGLDYLLTKELEGRVATLTDGLARGAPSDYSEYCKVVGEFRGLKYALDALARIRKQIGAEDE